MSERFVLAVIFHQIGPYHSARLNAAARGAAIVGIEWSGKEVNPWGGTVAPPSYAKVSLFPGGDVEGRSVSELADALDAALDQSKPSVVAVNGWNDFGSLITIRCCLRRNIPMVVMSESSRSDDRRRWWTELAKRRLVATYRAALAGGRAHKEYLEQLGMPADKIFLGYDAVDNQYFARSAKEVESRKEKVEKEYGLPENYFLASARFIEKKNLFRLLKAYGEYRKQAEVESRKAKVEWSPRGRSDIDGARRVSEGGLANQIWDLVLLGDGPLRSDLQRLISDLGLQHCVLLPGFKQYDELPVYYGLANVFIHASTSEQWGLVVNEAMASGLPVLVSNRCGCAADLVEEGRNGFIFDPRSQEQITEKLLYVSSMPAEERAQFGGASREIISHWGTDRFAEGLLAAAGTAIAAGPKRAGLLDSLLLEALIRR